MLLDYFGKKMKQRIIGATFLVAGTTIGAGMLAIPMTSAGLGFAKSTILLTSLWLYMVLAAVLMVEISKGKGQSIAALADKHLGPVAKHIAGASLLVLFWSLLAAYISGGSSILHQEFGGSQSVFSLIYTGVLGFCVISCTKVVDHTNRFLFVIKCVVFFVIIFTLLPFIEIDRLMMPVTYQPPVLLQAIPVFFTAFGFHGSLPSIINYLHGNKKGIYISIFAGSAIPLVVYILWQAITLGVLGANFENTGNVGLFISYLTAKTGSFYLTALVDLFAFLAIATSFLGVALGLFDYVSEWFPKKLEVRKKIAAAFCTFTLPLLFSLFYPSGFVFALGFASIALSLLAVIFPSLIALFSKSKMSFFLSKGVSLFMLFGGAALIFIEIIAKLAL